MKPFVTDTCLAQRPVSPPLDCVRLAERHPHRDVQDQVNGHRGLQRG